MTLHQLFQKIIEVPALSDLVFVHKEYTTGGNEIYVEYSLNDAEYDEETGKVIFT